MKILITFGTLFLIGFLEHAKCSTRPVEYDLRLWDPKRNYIESRGSIMDKGEEGDGGGAEQETDSSKKEDADSMSTGPSSSSKANNNNKRQDKKSSKDADDVMSDLLHPKKEEKNGTTTLKPFVVVTNSKNKPSPKKPKPDSGDEGLDEMDLKSSIEKALEKATSIADNIGDAIKAAINSVASQLKNATDVSASATPCSKSSNCSSTQTSLDAETTPSTSKASGPMSSTTKRQRRSSEIVAKWPPTLPLSAMQTNTFSQDSSSEGEDQTTNITMTQGGIISKGKVGSSSEESDEQGQGGVIQMTTSKGNGESSGSEGSEDERGSSQNEESEARSNMTKNLPPGKSNKTMKTTSQRDITLTVSGSGMGSGSGSYGSGSSLGSSVSGTSLHPQQPQYSTSRKPGRCRPLTSGLACIALSPDASQCSSDNGCPGTKKCCFYGCAPYTGVGICEYPVLTV